MTNEVIDSDESNRAIKIVKALEPKYRITEVPNPEYKKAMRDRKAFSPQPGSIRQTDKPIQPSLAEQIQQREKQQRISIIMRIADICDYCQDCSDCGFAKDIQAMDRCTRVKRNLVYLGVITE